MQPHLPDFPPHIVIELTYRCNLRCRMCWWWGAQGVAEARENLDDELSLAEWKKFVDSVAPFRPGIRITGGEPFLRPDSIELAAYITGQGMACSFITNGTLLDQARIERLVSSGVWQINFSIDGDRQGDESVRGPGAFDRTLAAIQALTAEKIRQKTGRPEVLVNCVVTPENVAGISSLAGLCRSLGLSLRIQHLMWLDSETFNRHEAALIIGFGLADPTLSAFILPADRVDVDLLISELDQMGYLAFQDPDRPALTLPRLKRDDIQRWYNDLSFFSAKGCAHVLRTGRIKANGEVVGCAYINLPLGNIRNQDFGEIFRSPQARSFRESLADELLPGCVRCCKL